MLEAGSACTRFVWLRPEAYGSLLERPKAQRTSQTLTLGAPQRDCRCLLSPVCHVRKLLTSILTALHQTACHPSGKRLNLVRSQCPAVHYSRLLGTAPRNPAHPATWAGSQASVPWGPLYSHPPLTEKGGGSQQELPECAAGACPPEGPVLPLPLEH